MFALCRPKHRGSTPIRTPGNFGPKWPTPCWFECRRHLIANCGQCNGHNGEPIGNHHRSFEWCHGWPPSTSSSPKMGVPYAPNIREWPYLRKGWSDTVHVLCRSSSVGFSGSADQMALFPVTSNPSWQQAATLDNFEWPHLHNGSFEPFI